MINKLDLFNYLQDRLSNSAKKYYSISNEYKDQLIIKTNSPFENVETVICEKDDEIEFKISIPNSRCHAYTFKEASEYLWLLNGCAEINTLFKEYVERKNDGKI